MVPFVKTKSGLAVFDGKKMIPVGTDHINYVKINALVQDTSATPEMIIPLLDVVDQIKILSNGNLIANETKETLEYRGRSLPAPLTQRALEIIRAGEDLGMLEVFIENLMGNPSFRAVEELYGFLEACSLPLTSDGCFLAYKKVRYDYTSIHASPDGTHMDNSIGSFLTMPRNMVDEDKSRTCSSGLHVCSFPYLKQFGGSGVDEYSDRVVICKVNPRDVVSVPEDYDNQKMRVCAYEVIGELPNDGETQLLDWCYGKRDIAFVRTTLESLRSLVVEIFQLEETPRTAEPIMIDDASDLMLMIFFERLVEEFDLPKHITADMYWDSAEVLSLKNLLIFISNWA